MTDDATTSNAARDELDSLHRLRSVFDAVVDLAVDDRAAALARLAPDDLALQQQVLALLERDDATDVRLRTPVFSDAVDAVDPVVGTRLGPYELVRLIGRGGMGSVYEAVRADDQYRKRVAIKLVQQGLDSQTALARFRRERQILANLEHRNIATLLDGGVAADGRPFLVMEYLEGEPITRWCDTRQMPVRERLGLFRQVCAAVQHAHKNLVVHGDLKPGNIIVTNDGTVKLLDFGIATLLSADVDAEQPITRGAARAMTPEYASPEQLRGEPLSTATDVFSLGVVLFELLTGRRPHHVESRALIDVERAVLNTPAPTPSTVAGDAIAGTDAATKRGERTTERLRRRLAGDIDAIALRALAVEPSRRYASAESIADDVRRLLDGLPVRAQRDWAGYRIGKFVRRNAAAVAASVLVVVALIGGVITTTLQARRAKTAQVQAEEVSGFLQTILSSVKPATGGRDVPVSELLDSAAKRLPDELKEQPAARVALERVIATSYRSLGRYDEAERHLREAIGLAEKAPAADRVMLLNDLAYVYLRRNQLAQAESIFNVALRVQDATARTPDTTRAVIFDNLGSVAHERGDLQGAARLHTQALNELRRLLAPNDDRIAIAMNNVAVARGDLNEWAAAESLHREVISVLRRNHPEPNTLVADAENSLAGALDIQNKTLAAESVYVRVLAARKQLLGANHPDYAYTMFSYAMNQMDLKHYDNVLTACEAVLSLRGKTLPEAHPAVAAALQALGRARDQLGDTAGGREALQESLALRRKNLPPGSWLVASSEGVVGEHFAFTKDYARAEPLELRADSVLAAQMGDKSPRTQTNLRRLVTLYTAWGKPARAAPYQKRLDAVSGK